MKYILITFEDDKFDDTMFDKVVAALKKLRPLHVQNVAFGNGDLREYAGRHRKPETAAS